MDTNINIEDIYYDKYIKYKTKYLELKQLSGGSGVYEFCHNDYKINDVGRIIDILNKFSPFIENTNIAISNNKYKENINKIYKELEIMLEDLMKNYTGYFFNSTPYKDLKTIYDTLKNLNTKYITFIHNYRQDFKKESLQTEEQRTNVVTKFTTMLTENTSEIKKLKDIINNIIIKINNNNKFTNLIEKINFYFLEIDKGLTCSKPYIKVTNLITSKKQE
jgi:hypothetical protein